MTREEDAISRQVIKEQMFLYGFHAPDMTVTEFIEDLPPVNPKQKIGRWITDRCDMYKCSICGHTYTDLSSEKDGMNYCPNCGCYNSSEGE